MLEEVYANKDEVKPERSYVTHEGKMFCIDKYPNGEYRLAQLISSNPSDYLNENYQPGSPLH
ncbi:YlzJ-like family protein [Oceanobacillus luteolus]|nr:YlzJ-like family protein [Oceanobacillus luteolus]